MKLIYTKQLRELGNLLKFIKIMEISQNLICPCKIIEINKVYNNINLHLFWENSKCKF